MAASRRESVGRLSARKQSSTEPPTMQMVSVAVLPPRFAQGMAPPSGVAAAECFNWDERINWTHNEPVEKPTETPRRKSLLGRMGVSTARAKRNEDVPPFQFRQVPYDVWRKHYAKDAQGNYRGTHAPAEDCLLKPEDVSKWRLGEAKTKADLWTRGTERLPVYDEVRAEGLVPEYHDGTGDGAEERTAVPVGPTPQYSREQMPERREILNGMTAEEIIAAQKEKQKTAPKGNMTWKERIKKGAEFASMGAGS